MDTGHIYLIGFMCSGKTTVGRELARLLGIPWRDVDRVAEEQVGPLLPFIGREGEERFRELEAKVLEELSNGPRAVISCGGGTPLRASNRERMRRTGVTVHLDVSEQELMRRIVRAGGDRPLLFGLKGEALGQRVRDLLQERAAVYAGAEMVVPADAASDAVAARVAALLAGQSR